MSLQDGPMFMSNNDEIDRFKRMIAKSGIKRDVQGAMTTACSMLAAVMDLLCSAVGTEGAKEVLAASMRDFAERFDDPSIGGMH